MNEKIINNSNQIINEFGEKIKSIGEQFNTVAKKEDVAKISSGTPLFVSSTSEMTDITKNYVNTTDGYLYCHLNGSFKNTGVKYQEKGISDKSIIPSKTSFIYERNLIDLSKLIKGKFINGETGEETENVDYYCTDFIEILPNMPHSKTFYNHFAFYDSSKVFISGYTSNGINPFITPSNAKYIRCSVNKANALNFMLQQGTFNTDYVKYSDKPKLDGELKNINVKASNTDFIEENKNFFNYKTATDNYFINGATGELTLNESWCASDFIEVIIGDNYYMYDEIDHNSFYAFYDNNKKYLEGVNNGPEKYFTVPPCAKYVRVSFQKRRKQYCMLAKGITTPSIFSEYKPYGTLKSECLPSINTLSYWYKNKVLSTLGDSITYQATWQKHIVSKFNFAKYLNYGIGGTTISNVNQGMCTDERINAIDILSDVIIVMAGTNDWANNVPIGEKSLSNVDISTFYGACNVMFNKLKARFPEKLIICLGTPYGKYKDRFNFTDKYGLKNDQGLMTIDYGDILCEVAQRKGIPAKNVGKYANWSDENISGYVQFDGAYLHPNDDGGKQIASVGIGLLKEVEPVV